MEYIKIEDGKVVEHCSSRELPEGTEYQVVTDFQGYVGCDSWMINEDGTLRPESELISEGLIQDNRGTYYNTETKESKKITELDVEISEGYTILKPDQFDNWDGTEWITDTEAKLDQAKLIAISQVNPFRKNQLSEGFSFMDKLIQSDETSKATLTGYIVAIDSVTFPIEWRTADDTTLVIPDALTLSAMSLAMITFIQSIMVASWTVKDLIKEATSEEEIETITTDYLEG